MRYTEEKDLYGLRDAGPQAFKYENERAKEVRAKRHRRAGQEKKKLERALNETEEAKETIARLEAALRRHRMSHSTKRETAENIVLVAREAKNRTKG